MKPIRRLSLAALLVSAAAAVATPPPSMEVVHYWESGGERAAIGVIRAAFEAKGGVWKDRPAKGNDASRKIVLDRIVAGYPPGAMQWHAGTDLNEIVGMGAVANIDAVAVEGQWARVMPKVVLGRVSHGGKVYLAPVGIHAENWMWSNPRVFTDKGLKVPSTWREFLAAAPALEKRGIVPLAIGGGDWEAELVFNAILVSTVGKDAYRRLLDDGDVAVLKSAAGIEAFRILHELSRHAGSQYRGRSWSDATAEVIAGRAASQIMGDWAKGEFIKAGMKPGKDFDCRLAPGSTDVYLMVIDSFAFPVIEGEDRQRWQKKLAETVTDPAVQIRFSQLKGSIPVRNDVDLSQLDACAQLGMKVVARTENQVLPPSMRLQFNVRARMQSLVGNFFHDGSMTPEQAANALSDVFDRHGALRTSAR